MRGTGPFALLAGIAAVALTACGASRAPSPPAVTPKQEVRVPRTVITPEAASSIPELLQRARELAAASRHAEAARLYARVFELDPDGELAHEALFQAAVEHHTAGALELAAAEYEDVARRFPDRDRSLLAVIRAIALSLHLERWQRAGELARLALASGRELGPLSSVEVYAGGALANLHADDEKAAEWFIEKGRSVIDEHALDAAGRISEELAPLYFALGELRRRRAERIVFDPTPKNFAEVMENRCQLLLDAQSAYSNTFRAYDAHWSAMAGFRVGELYQRLHRDLMKIQPPPQADTEEKRKLFAAAMRRRYAILLEKALGMLEQTLSMSARTGETSVWVTRARAVEAEIREAQRREQEILAGLPYSRATLDQALEDLAARSKATPPGAPAASPRKGSNPPGTSPPPKSVH
jgi:hypothetical protein